MDKPNTIFTGAVLSQTRFTEFGEVRTDVGSISQTDFGYTFQRNLPDTGLMDYKARMYDPLLGRFIQPDSLVPGAANPQALNRFAYSKNNPINFKDPSGHKPTDDENKPKYVKGYSKNQFQKVRQYQGNTPYCGPFALAMIAELLTGKKTSGDEVNSFLEQNNKKLPRLGIPGKPLASGAQLFLPNNEVSYQKHGTIEQLKQNVDSGKLTMVGVSNQTFPKIIEDIFDGDPRTKATVGHYTVVAGYNDETGELILLDPGNQPGSNAFTPVKYDAFEKKWNGTPNLFIGYGEMITIE